MIGNAVPVQFAKILAQKIMDDLNEYALKVQSPPNLAYKLRFLLKPKRMPDDLCQQRRLFSALRASTNYQTSLATKMSSYD